MKKVLGMGAALVDILANVDDAWWHEHGGLAPDGKVPGCSPESAARAGWFYLQYHGGPFAPGWQGCLYLENWQRRTG